MKSDDVVSFVLHLRYLDLVSSIFVQIICWKCSFKMLH